jgi:beta-phosphoglucomutase-like phosphatase (HAD superfamily)
LVVALGGLETMSHVGPHRVPGGAPKAALFDVDGTLVDSMPRFYPAWNEAGAAHGGLRMSLDEFYGFGGWPLPEIVRELHRRCRGGAEAADDFVDAFLATHRSMTDANEREAGPPPVIACVAAVARAHAAAGVPVVAATSGHRSHVEKHLAAAGLSDLFPSDRIITAADLPKGRGKPEPDIFIRAAALAGADPADCVAYEDAEAGLRSAFAAGCEVIDVRDMPGYPLPDALATAMKAQRAARTWP